MDRDSYARARAHADELLSQLGSSQNAYDDVDVSSGTGSGMVHVGAEEDGPGEINPDTYHTIMAGVAALKQQAEAEDVVTLDTEDPAEHIAIDPLVKCPHCHGEIEYGSLISENAGFVISDDYEPRGLVEEGGELAQLYSGFVSAILFKQAGCIDLDSGPYKMTGTARDGFILVDVAKGLAYVMEISRCGEMDEVEQDALFIWILRDDDRDGDALGYILNGWVFARRGILPS